MRNFYYTALLLLSKFTDQPIFRPLHALTAGVYMQVMTPFIQFKLRRTVGDPTLRIIPRHSAQSGHNFNCFLSDLDLSVIFKKWDQDALLGIQVIDCLQKLKKLMLFIGEVEIYTQHEADELDLEIKASEKAYNFIRPLRKVQWMRQSHEQGPSKYHKFKALRSIRLIFKNVFSSEKNDNEQISTAISVWAESCYPMELKVIDKMLVENATLISDRVYSDYLGYHFLQDSKLQSGNQIALEKRYVGLLLALVPEDHHGDPQLNFVVRKIINEAPKLKKERHSLARIEALIVQSWSRTQYPVPDWAPLWIERLKQISVDC